MSVKSFFSREKEGSRKKLDGWSPLVPMYTIGDKLSNEFGPPFCAANDKVAVRIFWQLMKQSRVQEGMNDLILYCIGFFDRDQGILVPETQKEVPLEMSPEMKQKSEDAAKLALSAKVPV